MAPSAVLANGTSLNTTSAGGGGDAESGSADDGFVGLLFSWDPFGEKGLRPRLSRVNAFPFFLLFVVYLVGTVFSSTVGALAKLLFSKLMWLATCGAEGGGTSRVRSTA